MATFSIGLARNPAVDTDNSPVADLTPAFTSWRHSIQAIGGCWQGEGIINPLAGKVGLSLSEMETFFLQNIGKRIVVSGGGRNYWEGQIVQMELTTHGQTFVRSMQKIANRIQVIYSKVGDNVLTNGKVESGAWDQVGTPETHETSGSWVASGSTSMYVVTDAGGEGTQPHTGASVAISAQTAYTSSVIANVLDGVWTLKVQDKDTSDTLGQRSNSACGRSWLSCQLSDAHAASGALVQVTAAATGASAYFDNAMLRKSPHRSQTKWWEDDTSISEFGKIEGVWLEREMTDDEADGLAQQELDNNAWPRTEPADRGGTFAPDDAMPDQLVVTCMGMAWTLGWRHALTDGTGDADAHMTSLLNEAAFAGTWKPVIDTNSVEVYLESGNPVTVWREMEKVAKRGDDSGNSWMVGVYPGWEFRYEARPVLSTTVFPTYQVSGGALQYYGGGYVPPLEFAPGWCHMADMPGQEAPGGGTADDPRRVWLDEAWFIYEDGRTRNEWAREEK
jgi:hypothetical protein